MAQPIDDRLAELTDRLQAGIQDLYSSGRYGEYLAAMSKFHHYSFGNAMLILLQCPHASRVAGYTTWRKEFGRNVKRHEKGISILAPCPSRKYVSQEVKDPKTGKTQYNRDGTPKMETKIITVTRFKIATVFDVSQTEGKELPTLGVVRLTGEVENYQQFYDTLISISPVPVKVEPVPGEANGYFSHVEQRIVLRPGLSQIQSLKTLVHEIAHAKLHNKERLPESQDAPTYDVVEIFGVPGLFANGRITEKDIPKGMFCYDLRGSDYDPGMPVTVEKKVIVNHAGSILTMIPLDLTDKGVLRLTEDEGLNFIGDELTIHGFYNEQLKDRSTKEVEAESIAYVVCQHFGIDTSEYSFGYVAGWSKGKELTELKESLDLIHSTAGEIITALNGPDKTIQHEAIQKATHHAR